MYECWELSYIRAKSIRIPNLKSNALKSKSVYDRFLSHFCPKCDIETIFVLQRGKLFIPSVILFVKYMGYCFMWPENMCG